MGIALPVRTDAAAQDPLTSSRSLLPELVEAVRSLPYGRPSDRSVEGMLRERRGTCSTKHLFLAGSLERRFPASEPSIVHRVYLLDRKRATRLFGADVAAYLPPEGLVDVHRYLTALVAGKRIELDVTFPGPPWDRRTSLPLACAPGEDYPCRTDPDAEKRDLERRYCTQALREPFISALTLLGPRIS